MAATATIIFNGEDKSREAATSAKEGILMVGEAAETGGIAVGVFLGDFAAGLLEVAASEAWEAIKKGFDEIVQGGIESNAMTETFTAKFDVMMGSMALAKDRMDELQQVGFINPEQLVDIDKMDIKLVQVGLDSQDTAAKIGMSGATVRQDILNTATEVASGSADMGAKLQRVTFDITKFYETGSSQSITDLMRLGAVTKDELEKAGLEFDKHGHVVQDHATATGIILKELGDKYKNLNTISMDTLEGMKSNWEDLKAYIERTLTGDLFNSLKSGLKDVEAVLGSSEAKQAYSDINDAIGKIVDSFGKLFGTVGDNKSMIITALQDIASGLSLVGDAMQSLPEAWSYVETNFFEPIKNLAANAMTWGYNTVTSFADGMAQGVSSVYNALGGVGQAVTDMLESHSPPKLLPNLTTWGTGAINSYFDGWAKGDFAVFDSLKTQVSGLIKGLNGGNEISAIKSIIGTDAELKTAMDELAKTGDIGQATFDRIKSAAGKAGEDIVAFLKVTVDISKAQKDVAADQDAINKLNADFKAKIDANADALKAVNEAEKANNLAYQDAMRYLQDNLDAANSQVTAAKEDLDTANKRLEVAKQLADAGIQTLKNQLDTTREALNELDVKQRSADLTDRANATGKYAHTLQEEKLQLQMAQGSVATDELKYQVDIERIHKEINGGKKTGVDLELLKAELTSKQLAHEEAKLKTQDRIYELQQKIAEDSAGGLNHEKAALEIQKLKTEELVKQAEHEKALALAPLQQSVKDAKDNIQDKQAEVTIAKNAMADKAASHKVEVEQFTIKKDHLAQEKEHITQVHDAQLAADTSKLKADQTRMKAAQDHFKVMQDQTKEMEAQVKLADQLNKLEHPVTGGGGGKHGPGGGPPPPPDMQGGGKGIDTSSHGHRGEEDKLMKGVGEFTKGNAFEDFKKKIEDVQKQIEGLVKTVQDKLNSAMATIQGPIDTATTSFNNISSAVQGFWKWVTDLGTSLSNMLKPLNEHLGVTDRLGDSFKILSNDLMPKILPLWEAFKDLVATLTPIIVGLGAVALTPLLAFLGGLATALSSALPYALTAAGAAIDFFKDIFILAVDLIHGRWGKIWGDIGNILADVWTYMSNLIFAAVSLVVGYIVGFVTTIITWFEFLWDKLFGHSIVVDIANDLSKWFKQGIDWVMGHVNGFITDVTVGFTVIKDNITKAITDAVETVKTTFNLFTSGLLTNISTFADDVLKGAKTVGTMMVEGIKQGLDGAWDSLTSKLHDLASKLPDPVQKALGIHSPSTVFADEVGANIPGGVAMGVVANMGVAKEAIDAMSKALVPSSAPQMSLQNAGIASGLNVAGDAFSRSGAAPGAGQGQISINVTVNVTSSGGLNDAAKSGIEAAISPVINNLLSSVQMSLAGRR